MGKTRNIIQQGFYVVEDSDLQAFREKVNDFLKGEAGWKLHGNMIYANGKYIQALKTEQLVTVES